MFNKVFTNLLINIIFVSVQNYAIIGVGFVCLGGQVNVIDTWLDRSSLFHFVRVPLTILFTLNKTLAIHYQKALFNITHT